MSVQIAPDSLVIKIDGATFQGAAHWLALTCKAGIVANLQQKPALYTIVDEEATRMVAARESRLRLKAKGEIEDGPTT